MNEDKIIELWTSGNYELAYQLIKGLGIEIDLSKIDLISMKTIRDRFISIPPFSNKRYRVEVYFNKGVIDGIVLSNDTICNLEKPSQVLFKLLQRRGYDSEPVRMNGTDPYIYVASTAWKLPKESLDPIDPQKVLQFIFNN